MQGAWRSIFTDKISIFCRSDRLTNDQHFLRKGPPLAKDIGDMDKVEAGIEARHGDRGIACGIDQPDDMTELVGDQARPGLIGTIYADDELAMTGVGVEGYRELTGAPGDGL